MKGADIVSEKFDHRMIMVDGTSPDRYKHQLSPNIVKDPWSKAEDLAILLSQSRIGNKWTDM
jgi:hypothetical protein